MTRFIVLMLMAMLVAPMGVMAMSHEDHGEKMKMDHSEMEHGKKMEMDHSEMEMDHSEMEMDHSGMDHGKKMDHKGGMAMKGKKIMLQDQEVDGVMGSAFMKDVREAMAKHGMPQTHHIMIGFIDNEGEALKEGKVAVKVESPDGKVSRPIMMMGMGSAFGADITLDQTGMYHFKIGTKLEDGKKRTFHMHYDNK